MQKSEKRSRVGFYNGPIATERVVTGGKPDWLMRALVRDYSERGASIVDPFAGGATTLICAAVEGRTAIGSEMNRETFETAQKRINRGFTPTFF